MTVLLVTILAFAVFAASFGLTGWFRGQALAHRILDIPNARSSHTIATPRGGGVAIVLVTLVVLLALGVTDWLDWSTVWSLCLGGALVSVIGYVDDQGHVAPHWRLVGHFAAAFLVLTTLGGVPSLSAMGFALNSGWMGFAIATLYLVWILNLMNFMDGIDGIAGIETITVCVSAAILSDVAAPGNSLWIAPLVLALATLGFLVWNWPPARIFMGDVGSGFLGLTLAVLSLQAGWVLSQLFWVWVILLGVFVVDATTTLIRRMADGKRFYEAHRSHAYQQAAILRGTHLPVTIAVGAINVFWLMPVALAVALNRLDGLLGVVIAYTPLVVAALWLRAGRSLDL